MEVASEDVAAYLPRIQRFARMFNGSGGAEYDDLVQEGSLKVFLLLRDELPVTNTAIKRAMLNWVRFCRRKGMAHPMEDDAMDYYQSAAPGRKKSVLPDNGQTQSVWGHWADVG